MVNYDKISSQRTEKNRHNYQMGEKKEHITSVIGGDLIIQ